MLMDRRYQTVYDEKWIVHPIELAQWVSIRRWCWETFGRSIEDYDPQTDTYGNWFVPTKGANLVAFKYDADYAMFLMRWA